MKKKSPFRNAPGVRDTPDYDAMLFGIVELLDAARLASARTVNAIMTATYWELGRRIVELEQGGRGRANYGDELLKRLSSDLASRFGRGFSYPNLYKFRQFYTNYPPEKIFDDVNRIRQQDSIDTVDRNGSAGNQGTTRTTVLRACTKWSHAPRLSLVSYRRRIRDAA